MLPLLRLLLITLLLVAPLSLFADDQLIRIGVLSHRGDKVTLAMWSPTAAYLSQTIPGYHFEVMPLDFAEVDTAVGSGKVDFVLVNPGIYVNLEVSYRVSRIATLHNLRAGNPYNVFAGVVFTRADRSDMTRLKDLVGKRFAAVDETSLGGFQMAWRELRQADVNPYEDFSELKFSGIHDLVVMAVRDGRVDAGTVRSGILERMAADGVIKLEDFRIIHPRVHEGFVYAHSTRLYPEWPFSKVRHTDTALAQRVAVALLNMPASHFAAQAGQYSGWTIPLDYQPVHELFRELHLPPYQNLGRFTLWDAVQKYRNWLLTGLLFLLSMLFMTLWVMRLNRALERARLRLEQRHELILDSVADGIYGVDLEGKSTFINRAMERITGWRAQDMIGKNQHMILHHSRADGTPFPGTDCPVYKTFMDNRPRFVEDDLFWKKDGSCIPVEYSCTPIRDEKGDTVGSVVVFREITARKQAEEAARQHRKELAHVARLSTMGEMASGIAHEINQPLTAIVTTAQASIRMAESGRSSVEQLVDVMERVASLASHAGEVIRQVRSFVRKEPPELSRVDLSELVNEVALLFAPEARRDEVKLILELDQNLPLVRVQKIQIEQVILNLVRNAIEAMSEIHPKQRRLQICTQCLDSDFVEVRVRDSGPGLSEAVSDQLFEPFITTKKQGMGLGLSISRGIIDNHGGKLSVTSQPGEGALFTFQLPIAR